MRFVDRFSVIEREDIVNKSIEFLWTDEGKPGQDYLLNRRKLSEKVIREFKIGYLPQDLDHQLHGRLILPLYDPSCHLIAVTTRSLSESSGSLPKYWHERYKKDFYLFGIQIAKSFMRERQCVIVVEGQFDVLQLHNYNVENTVALCGTRMSDMQLSVIYRYCDQIILMLDNDLNIAGQKGMEAILSKRKAMLNQGHLVREDTRSDLKLYEYQRGTEFPLHYKIVPIYLSEAKDPDEFIRKHGFPAMRHKVKGAVEELRRENA